MVVETQSAGEAQRSGSQNNQATRDPTSEAQRSGSHKEDLWVFGYGSLMWRPGFAYAERSRASLDGYHRCFCISSTHHRGSATRPGLVLGLDRGGTCEGVAYRIAPENAGQILAYLRERELVSGVYREVMAPIELHDGARSAVSALAYIVERAHPSFVRLPLAAQAHQIRGARGLSGDNLDYLINTVHHLQEMGIRERDLERLVALAAPHVAQRARWSASPDRLTCAGVAAIRAAVSRHPDPALRLKPDQRRRFMYRLPVATARAARLAAPV